MMNVMMLNEVSQSTEISSINDLSDHDELMGGEFSFTIEEQISSCLSWVELAQREVLAGQFPTANIEIILDEYDDIAKGLDILEDMGINYDAYISEYMQLNNEIEKLLDLVDIF